ncbi:MAG: YgiQ family radical SAM protein [Clostridiales bacterium]|nr:MAG: YgiQ family radical SAM protein [Clostridiales bacterium]
MPFLPICKKELEEQGIKQLDFICITGDAYVDHPSFGVAIISRLIESLGYSVGIIAQPQKNEDFIKLGQPKYAFMVSSGCVDSMVSNYTAAKKLRSEDVYSPGGKAGRRPDRAVIVYCNKIRENYGKIPIIIGGLEASLRRFAHYDYWQDKVRNSILLDSGADMLSFGMGERQTKEICKRLAAGEKIETMTDIAGTCVLVQEKPVDAIECAPAERLKQPTEDGKRAYAEATKVQFRQQDAFEGKPIVQRHGDKYLLQNIPAEPLDKEDLDAVYALPYMRAYHPSYEEEGGVPAIEEVEHSITHNRGCFGGCNFCAIAFHQGRLVTSRTKQSVVDEAIRITKSPNFKGYINDIGGPTANFRHGACDKKSVCKNKKCMAPQICPTAKKNVSHEEYLDILRTVRALPKVKKVFIRSGVRYDYLVADENREFFRELVKYHISGQLKVAPEHTQNKVLDYMGKPHFDVYEKFYKQFYEINKQLGQKQYLVPYLISSHPGCTLSDAIELALYLKKINYHPEQVQDFYPTPGTISTAMFYTELDPITLKKVYVPKSPQEKAEQRALLQYTLPKNREIVRKALVKAGRSDLIRVLLPSQKRRF